MPCHLQIKITGLCMIVPAADGKTVHVLLPKSDDQGGGRQAGHHVPKHEASLHFHGRKRPLNGWTLDLSHLEGELQTTLPEGIVNLSDPRLTDTRIDLDAVSSRLAGRVILGAGCFTHRDGLAFWNFPKTKHPPAYLANWMTWTIPNIAGEKIDLNQAGLDGNGSTLFERVHVGNGNVLRMDVRHLPPGDPGTPGDPGPEPEIGDPPGHFHAFFSLLQESQADHSRATPAFLRTEWGLSNDIPESCVTDETSPSEWMFGQGPEKFFGRTYNCIVIGGGG